MITYDDFAKVEIRAGKILSAEKIPDTDKLLKLMVDLGEKESVPNAASPEIPPTLISKPRQIVSGIALYFPDPLVLVGRTCMFVANLEPRKIKGYDSNGMLFAVSTPEGAFSLLEPKPVDPSKGDINPGTQAK
jgi:tRNA-binding EMAP/Myf-like protein